MTTETKTKRITKLYFYYWIMKAWTGRILRCVAFCSFGDHKNWEGIVNNRYMVCADCGKREELMPEELHEISRQIGMVGI